MAEVVYVSKSRIERVKGPLPAGDYPGRSSGTLDARKVNTGRMGMVADVRGEIELEGNVLVIKRIHVTYHLQTSREDKVKVDRAYVIHAENCPVYLSLRAAIDITTELDLQEFN